MVENILNYIKLENDKKISFENNILSRLNLIKNIKKDELKLFLEVVKTNKYKDKEINLEKYINILSNKIYEVLEEKQKHNYLTNFFNCRSTKIFYINERYYSDFKKDIKLTDQLHDFINFFDEKKYTFNSSQINKILKNLNFSIFYFDFKEQNIKNKYLEKLRSIINNKSLGIFNFQTIVEYLKNEDTKYLEEIRNTTDNILILSNLEKEMDNRLNRSLKKILKDEIEVKINKKKRKL